MIGPGSKLIAHIGVCDVCRFGCLDLGVGTAGLFALQEVRLQQLLQGGTNAVCPPHRHHSVPVDRIVREPVQNGLKVAPGQWITMLPVLFVGFHGLFQGSIGRPCTAIAFTNLLCVALLQFELLH